MLKQSFATCKFYPLKIILILSALLIWPALLSADVIYLKNGQTISGALIGQDGRDVLIRNRHGNNQRISKKSIRRIKYGETEEEQKKRQRLSSLRKQAESQNLSPKEEEEVRELDAFEKEITKQLEARRKIITDLTAEISKLEKEAAELETAEQELTERKQRLLEKLMGPQTDQTAALVGDGQIDTSSIYQDKFVFGLHLWPGDYSADLESRFLLDGAVTGQNQIYAVNTEWGGKNSMALPISLHYYKNIDNEYKDFRVIAGARITAQGLPYRFSTLGASNYLGQSINTGSSTEFEDSYQMDFDLEAGISVGVLKDYILLEPVIGQRRHSYDANINGSGLGGGNNIFLFSALNPAHNTIAVKANGNYMGLGVELKLNDRLSVKLERTIFGNITGDYKQKARQDLFGINNSNKDVAINYVYSQNWSGYELSSTRDRIIVQYSVSDTTHLQVGFQKETYERSYPLHVGTGAISLCMANNLTNCGSASATSGFYLNYTAPTNTELASDLLFYSLKQTTRKGMIYFGFVFDTIFKD